MFTNFDRTLIFEAETSRKISVNRVLPRLIEQIKVRLHRTNILLLSFVKKNRQSGNLDLPSAERKC